MLFPADMFILSSVVLFVQSLNIYEDSVFVFIGVASISHFILFPQHLNSIRPSQEALWSPAQLCQLSSVIYLNLLFHVDFKSYSVLNLKLKRVLYHTLVLPEFHFLLFLLYFCLFSLYL